MKNNKIKTPAELKRIVSELKIQGRRIAFTNGCFDIIHAGHIEYLKDAKALADILIAALNTDSSVKKIKGPTRPVMRLKDRQEIVAALGCVDYVTSFQESTPLKLIKIIKPDLVIKGADWKAKGIVGRSVVSAYGGRAITVKYKKGYSTTNIIEKIVKRFK